MAVHEHEHLRRHPLDLVQHVRRHDHRAPLVAQPVQHLDDLAPLRRVEAVQRLVEQQQVGLVGEGLGELHALAHAVGEAAHLALGDVGEADRLERPVRAAASGSATLCRRAHSSDDLVRGQERPRRALVGDDADPLVHVGVPARLDAEDAHRPALGEVNPAHSLSVVDLPAPLWPRRPVTPGPTANVTSATATVSPYQRETPANSMAGTSRHASSPRNRHTSTSAETAISASQVSTHAVFDGWPTGRARSG